ncbi:MAG: fasciclin domain-containing protein [Rubricella sp.]
MPSRIKPILGAAILAFLAGCIRSEPSVFEMIATDEELSIFASLLEDAELDDDLDFGPFIAYTVFAPNNDAFARLPPGTLGALRDPANRATLSAVLRYHILDGGRDTGYFAQSGPDHMTRADNLVRVVATGNGLLVDGVSTSLTDRIAVNGIVHVVEGLLIPSPD